MTKRKKDRPNVNANNNPDDEPFDEGGAAFAWEFVNDEHAGHSPSASPRITGGAKSVSRRRGAGGREAGRGGNERSGASTPGPARHTRRPDPAVLPRGGSFGSARANYIREQLDQALDRWWAQGEIPPVALLRDGLLLLEAGGSVSEGQRTLLLRAALAYDRGVQTALRHQADAERVALVLAEAVVEWELPLSPERLSMILAGDETREGVGDKARDEEVVAALGTELERSRVLLTGEARRRAEVALEMLPRSASEGIAGTGRWPASPSQPPGVARRRRPFRQMLFILLLFALLGFIFWHQRRTIMPADMVAMPAALYYFVDQDGTLIAQVPVELDAFFIDRFEVTNRDYRRCVERSACPWPVRTASATRTDYFTNPAFELYPVVNVTQAMAASYCTWQGERLPSAAEWQAAASVAPAAGQQFRFPWGASFEVQRANSGVSGFGDTLVVGSFRPGGDSPRGAADMAGNVAEWTATLVPGPHASEISSGIYSVVKGGSYASTPEMLAAGAEMHIEVGSAMPELGFRCARTQPAS